MLGHSHSLVARSLVARLLMWLALLSVTAGSAIAHRVDRRAVAGQHEQLHRAVAEDTNDVEAPFIPTTGGGTSTSTDIPSGLIELTAEQLAQVGIHYDTASIAYIEDGLRFVVSTTGISITGSNGKSDARTPRHVTLYENGTHVASWKRSHPDDDVDRLVGIIIRFHDRQTPETNHQSVAVVWVIPPAGMPVPTAKPLVDVRTEEQGTDTGTTDSPLIMHTALRPNPVAGSTATLTIDAQRPCLASITLYDVLGNRVATIADRASLTDGAQDILLTNLHEQPQGMYMVVIDIPETQERHARRLLIER